MLSTPFKVQVITLSAFRPKTLGQGRATYCTLAVPCTCVVREKPAYVQAKTVALDCQCTCFGLWLLPYSLYIIKLKWTKLQPIYMWWRWHHCHFMSSVSPVSTLPPVWQGVVLGAAPWTSTWLRSSPVDPCLPRTTVSLPLSLWLCVWNILSWARIPRCNTAWFYTLPISVSKRNIMFPHLRELRLQITLHELLLVCIISLGHLTFLS